MKKLVLKVVVAGSLVASALGIGVGPASATIIHQDGCVEWNNTQGCVVRQYCDVDTVNHSWSCLRYDTRTHMLSGETGVY